MSYQKVFSHDEESMDFSVEVKFLHYTFGFWDFPKNDDTKFVDTKYVFLGPCTPAEITKSGYTFKEDTEALEKV